MYVCRAYREGRCKMSAKYRKVIHGFKTFWEKKQEVRQGIQPFAGYCQHSAPRCGDRKDHEDEGGAEELEGNGARVPNFSLIRLNLSVVFEDLVARMEVDFMTKVPHGMDEFGLNAKGGGESAERDSDETVES